ncbi:MULTISPECIES: DUF3108 domain-containing protein [Eikenella]|uniref:DUF3108 domain-containing protein n=1 Tax=Eikenella longinqua TaxID=1795827 RepID=A0A1A9S1H5_9NEIS|nr:MULTISPECIES: DUF3108 domain-containing protein [Eikenella]OAM31270.1 DUF3108 domain-containing protein [Eikenella longinqua]
MTTLRLTAVAALFAAAFAATPAVADTPFPQNAELHYVGPYGVPAVMNFSQNGGRYSVSADINVPLYKMRFSSNGSITGKRLQPARYSDTRKGRPYAGATFNYGAQTITYGKTGQTETQPISGPTFDLFTLAWQLALNNGQLPANLHITNGKRVYPVRGMTRLPPARYNINGASIPVNRFRVQRGDDTIEYAFAPDFANIPARIKYTDDGKTYELKLRSGKIDGQPIQPAK